MQQCQWCLSTVSLYGSTSTNNMHDTVVSSVSCLCRYESHKTTVQLAHRFLIHTGALESCRQLQLHCLSRLNPFIPCVCAFTYLSSSILFTADTVTETRVAPVVLAVSVVNHAREHVNIPDYTEHFGAYADLGNQSATNAG